MWRCFEEFAEMERRKGEMLTRGVSPHQENDL